MVYCGGILRPNGPFVDDGTALKTLASGAFTPVPYSALGPPALAHVVSGDAAVPGEVLKWPFHGRGGGLSYSE